MKFLFGKPFDRILNSKFCPPTLLRDFSDVVEAASPRANISIDEDEISADLPADNAKHLFVDETGVTLNGLSTKLHELKKMFEGSSLHSLIVRNVVFVKRLDVGILLILNSAFQRVGFVSPRSGRQNAVVFTGFKGNGILNSLDEICTNQEKDRENGHELLQVFSMFDLTSNRRLFAEIVNYNSASLKSTALYYLRNNNSV